MADNNEIEKAAETEKTAKEAKVAEKQQKPAKTKKPGIFSKLGKLFKESRVEAKKVTWAGKLATTKNTVLVIVVLIIVGVVFGLFDMGFRWLVDFIMDLY